MAEETASGGTDLVVQLDSRTLEALQQAAEERGVAAGELASRWLRERLAHESERRLGRSREQRGSG